MKVKHLNILILFLVFTGFTSFKSWSQQNSNQTKKEVSSKINIQNRFLDYEKKGNEYLKTNLSKLDSIIQTWQFDKMKAIRFEQLPLTLFELKYYEMTNNWQDFNNSLKNLDETALREGTPTQITQGFYFRSLFASRLGQYGLALREINKAYPYIDKKLDYSNLYTLNASIAKIKINLNQKDSALYYMELAFKNARSSGSKVDLAKCFNLQSQFYNKTRQVDISVAKNLIAYQLAISENDLFLMAKFSRQIGDNQAKIKNFKDAEYYYTESYVSANEILDKNQMALALTANAVVYGIQNQTTQSIELLLEAKKLFKEMNSNDGLGLASLELGKIYEKAMTYTLAEIQFNESQEFFQKSNNEYQLAEVYELKGNLFFTQGKLDKAAQNVNKSIQIRKSLQLEEVLSPSYRLLAEIYNEKGDYPEAIKNYQRFLTLEDDFKSKENSQKIAELSEVYRSEQRDIIISQQADSLDKQIKEKQLTQAKLENSSLKNELQTYVIIGFLVIILLSTIIGFYRYQRNAIKQRTRELELSQSLLRTQMNPHFIFNAMSVIQSYIYDNDVQNSSRFLVSFSRLIRLILENSPKEFISLDTEIDILNKYLETQKIRFEERFTYEIDCPEDLVFEGAMIPPMITQPFIENAIEHGRLHLSENGYINVKFVKAAGMLNITISDNGIGRKKSEENSKGKEHKSMALDITQKRIENINLKYKADGFMRIRDLNQQDGTGTQVLISIPIKLDSSN